MTGRAGPTRRGALALAAGGAAGLALPRRAWSRAGPPVAVGGFEVIVLSDGDRTLPRDFLWAGVDPAAIAAAYEEAGEAPPPEAMPVPNNVTLIRGGGRVILVDAGSGPNFDPASGRLEEALLAEGIAPEDVSDVVFTHGHPDHLWGALDDFEEFPRFAAARHVIAAEEVEYWRTFAPEGEDDFRAGMALGANRVIDDLGDVLETVAMDAEIAPGVRLLPTPGHTPGHVAVLVEDGGAGLVVLGDALTNPVLSFRRPAWPMGTDDDPELAVGTRSALLARLAAEDLAVIGFHLPFPGLGHVRADGEAYRFAPA